MTRLTFRTRLFVALFVASAVPLAIVAVWGALLLSAQPRLNPEADIYPVGATGARVDSLLQHATLSSEQRQALVQHDSVWHRLLSLANNTRAQEHRWQLNGPAALVVAAGIFVLILLAAGSILSRQYASPLNEIIDWTRRIRRHEPLPESALPRATPELVSLRESLYDLQVGLEQARVAELEAERLRAFGEVARRVAHEMKNPLTPIRLAVRQLSRSAPDEWKETLDVIAAESARLEAMAKDFAELGRLPQGVAAPVDLCELLEDLLRNAVPDGMDRRFTSDTAPITVMGHYDALRRAFSNVLRNAVEACNGKGTIAVCVGHHHGRIHIALEDNGPGIPRDKRDLIFQPYYTEKPTGTGLGLAIVRQTIEQHGGTIAIADTPRGARFVFEFPA